MKYSKLKSPSCYKIIRYKLFLLSRKFGNRYKFEKRNWEIDLRKNNNEFELFVISDTNNDFIGYGTINNYMLNTVQISLSVDFKQTESGTNYSGKELLKGVYDRLLKEIKPSHFNSLYANDNKDAFFKEYIRSHNFRLACVNTPSGKVLVKRAFDVVNEEKIINIGDIVEVKWKKLTCKGW